MSYIGVPPQPRDHTGIVLIPAEGVRWTNQMISAFAAWRAALLPFNLPFAIAGMSGGDDLHYIEAKTNGDNGEPGPAMESGLMATGNRPDDLAARGTLRSVSPSHATACHELGHALGLGHSQHHHHYPVHRLQELIPTYFKPEVEWAFVGAELGSFRYCYSRTHAPRSIMEYGKYGDTASKTMNPTPHDGLTVAAIYRPDATAQGWGIRATKQNHFSQHNAYSALGPYQGLVHRIAILRHQCADVSGILLALDWVKDPKETQPRGRNRASRRRARSR